MNLFINNNLNNSSFFFFGCIICLISIALPGWQILNLTELNALHEHSILYDCIISEVTPLNSINKNNQQKLLLQQQQPSRQCTYKFENFYNWKTSFFVKMAFEEKDFNAREYLNNHRFLPQHKSVLFFCIFTLLFSFISIFVIICSSCFIPNIILNTITIGLATICSILADISFWISSENNNKIKGSNTIIYQQYLSYAFFIHCFGSLIILFSFLFKYNNKRRRKQKNNLNEILINNNNNLIQQQQKQQQNNNNNNNLLLSDLFCFERAALTASLEALPPPQPPPCTPQYLLLNNNKYSNYSLINENNNIKCSDKYLN
ncbi:hypothetical protein Mgra_00002120 [Meloidogyne graminicola]|uniref:Uncharacterized protein n=1 Tax=Meloidogyne graminicola TaxID=189291 RepID=A0A8S9ZZW5_9BILA|nr:hypothetical protein Mgra_00002120 [Meloidogyne graminicola]